MTSQPAPGTGGRRPSDTLANRLILLRTELHWSQRRAADVTGLTYGEWQSMENGAAARDLPTKLRKISRHTGYELEWLLWGGPLTNSTSPDGDGTDAPAPGLEPGTLCFPAIRALEAA